MLRVNYRAVAAAAVAAFITGGVWYSPLLFGDMCVALRVPDRGAATGVEVEPLAMAGELLRMLLVAYVLARFAARLGVDKWRRAAALGLWVWLGFEATLLSGAVLHDAMPPMLYAIHAGDALAKMLVMTAIIGVWPRRTEAVAARRTLPGT